MTNQKEKLYFETYFYNRFGFYNYELTKAAKHPYFKELMLPDVIVEEGEETAASRVIEDVIQYDFIDYCKENNYIPV